MIRIWNLYLYLDTAYQSLFRFDTCHLYACSPTITSISAICMEEFGIIIILLYLQNIVYIASVSLLVCFYLVFGDLQVHLGCTEFLTLARKQYTVSHYHALWLSLRHR